MLNFLFKKNQPDTADELNKILAKLENAFGEVSGERKKYLQNLMKEYGYLPYPYYKALEELTPSETIFALKEKWIQNNVYKNNKLEFT